MTAQRVGRNDPCPCGSGKKYKKCCLASKEGAPSGTSKPFGSREPLDLGDKILDDMQGDLRQLSQLTRDARAAIDAGQHEEAARLSGIVQERFPALIEGPRILAQLNMAQGRWADAAAAYELAIAIIGDDKDSFDASVLEEMQRGLADARSKTTP